MQLNCKVIKKWQPPISTSSPPFQSYPLFLANFLVHPSPKWLNFWKVLPLRLPLIRGEGFPAMGTYDCYENIKIKLWSTISILKPWHINIFRYKNKMIVSSTMFCKMLHPCCYWGIPCNILLSPLNRLVTCHLFMSRMYIIRTSSEHNQWKRKCSKR